MEPQERQKRRAWPCVEFCRLDVRDPEQVAAFLLWLCDRSGPHEVNPDLTSAPGELIEALWGWHAPRHRMAKLLWQVLQGDSTEEYFHRHFFFHPDALIEASGRCNLLLPPIQDRLRPVLDSLAERRRADAFIGQGAWGEEWWLPADQADHVRQQLRRARPDILTRSSDYEDAISSVRLPYFDPPSADPERAYIGSADHGFYVYVEDQGGCRHPLPHAPYSFYEAPGTGFGWGYPGHGPVELARAILADATDGDLEVAEKCLDPFDFEVLMPLDQRQGFRLSRGAVLDWLARQGVGAPQLQEAAQRVASLRARFGEQIAAMRRRMDEIATMGGLVAQRFDIVPADFECALYVDLMHLLERGGWVLRCARCKLPIGSDDSPRGSHQRARWEAGSPVYHPECFAERARERKRQDWARRAGDTEFRHAERKRARQKRKRDARLAQNRRKATRGGL